MQLNDKKQKLNCTTQGYPRFLVVVQGMWLYYQKKNIYRHVSTRFTHHLGLVHKGGSHCEHGREREMMDRESNNNIYSYS